MPRPSRICSVEDCGRRHHAKGFCRRCYGEQVRKAKQRERSASLAAEVPKGDHYARLSIAMEGGIVKGPAKVMFSDGTEKIIPLGGTS